MFDMTKLDLKSAADKGATITLRHPATDEEIMDEKGKPVTITVIGTDSAIFKKLSIEHYRVAMLDKPKRELISKEELLKLSDVEYDKEMDIRIEEMQKAKELQTKRTANLMSKCSTAWSGIGEGKKEHDFSQETAEYMYLKYDWILKQIDDAVGERTNFLQA
jgi:hypothetical protein